MVETQIFVCAAQLTDLIPTSNFFQNPIIR